MTLWCWCRLVAVAVAVAVVVAHVSLCNASRVVRVSFFRFAIAFLGDVCVVLFCFLVRFFACLLDTEVWQRMMLMSMVREEKNERFSEAPAPPTMTTTRTQFSAIW